MNDFDILATKVQDVVGHMEWCPEASAAFRLNHLLCEIVQVFAFNAGLNIFFDIVYGCYVNAMVEHDSYFLSDLDILARVGAVMKMLLFSIKEIQFSTHSLIIGAS